jgi:hypothetical protein
MIEKLLEKMPVPVILFKNDSKECEDRAKLLLTTAHIYQEDTMVMMPLSMFTKFQCVGEQQKISELEKSLKTIYKNF